MTDPIKAEPVAWMYSSPHGVETTPDRYAEREGYTASNWRGWTETPLYTAAQLVEERRLAWNEAIEAAATVAPAKTAADECETVGQWTRRTLREAIRALSVPAIVEAGDGDL